jgi:ABC-type transport system substrate-binding protein
VLTRQLHAAMVESDLGRRQALYAAIARYERDHPPGLMLWQRPDFDVVAANLDGYAPVQDMLHLERLARRLP